LPANDGSRVPTDSPISVKEAVLPFKRFRTPTGQIVDAILGPEMKSTGEVMGIDRDFPRAFAKSQEAAFGPLPTSGTAFVSVADRDKRAIVLPVLRLTQLGFDIVATSGTAEMLARNGIPVRVVAKFNERSGEDTIVELIARNEVDLVINTPSGPSAMADGYEIRTAAVLADKPLFTSMAQVSAAVASIDVSREGMTVTSLQEYQRRRDEQRGAKA
jgi:carbamoyl-phosphate synthase large subunit